MYAACGVGITVDIETNYILRSCFSDAFYFEVYVYMCVELFVRVQNHKHIEMLAVYVDK